jgi:hypothetical protein
MTCSLRRATGLIQAAPVILLLALFDSSTRAADWPMWRYNAGRGAATPHALPE